MTKISPRTSRREFIGAFTAGGLSILGSNGAKAESRQSSGATKPPSARRRIDVHHHILPPEYVRLVGKDVIGRLAVPIGATPQWDVAASLRIMDEQAISAAIVSVSAPGLWFGDTALTQRLARSCNEFAAQMAADHPKRFGFFAAMPLPNVKASLAELTHAIDVLKCDGIGLITNYGDRYLGDPEFKPLFDEINRRRVPVYVHPTVCSCDQNLFPDIPPAMIEFPHSTTRTVVSLLNSETFTRCPDIPFIFSHAGGTIPFLVNRISSISTAVGKPGWYSILKRLNYDTALSVNAAAFSALLKMVTSKQVLFGTDFPFAGVAAAKLAINGLQTLGLSDNEIQDIEAGNAVRLFRRFAE